jgi:hypothetical protein
VVCDHCGVKAHSVHRHTRHAHHRTHHYHSSGSLTVTYSGCQPTCCRPQKLPERTVYGDYVVFSAQPTSTKNTYSVKETSYNPDRATMDDGRADLQLDYRDFGSRKYLANSAIGVWF